jgi:hypothetical protein
MSNLKIETLGVSIQGNCSFCNSQKLVRGVNMDGVAVEETATVVQTDESGLVVCFCDDCMTQLATWAVDRDLVEREDITLCGVCGGDASICDGC